MATTYSTGAVALFAQNYAIAGTGGPALTGPIMFLGHGDVAPRRVIRRHKIPVKCDLSGPSAPFDLMEGGKEAFISVALARWNWATYNAIADPYFSPVGSAPGSSPYNSRGTLIATEGKAHLLIMVFPYGLAGGGHPAMIAQGMPGGYRFGYATLEQDDDLEPGTQPNKLHLMWHAIEGYNPTTGAFTLFDTAVPSALFNPTLWN